MEVKLRVELYTFWEPDHQVNFRLTARRRGLLVRIPYSLGLHYNRKFCVGWSVNVIPLL